MRCKPLHLTLWSQWLDVLYQHSDFLYWLLVRFPKYESKLSIIRYRLF